MAKNTVGLRLKLGSFGSTLYSVGQSARGTRYLNKKVKIQGGTKDKQSLKTDLPKAVEKLLAKPSK